jgi:hypothetical protein
MHFTNSLRTIVMGAGLILASVAVPSAVSAQQAKPAAAKAKNEMRMPKKATARCGDSTWSKADSQKGACSSHGGVAKWFGKAPANMTARCSDGEYWTNEERRGACSAHGGVAFWVATGKKAGKS